MSVDVTEMKKLMLVSGKLSEWHERNLKNFVMVALDNVEKVEIRYDIGDMRGKAGSDDKRGAGYVIYDITKKKTGKLGKNPTELKKRYAALDKWVKDIMWADTRVEVIMKGKTLFPPEVK